MIQPVSGYTASKPSRVNLVIAAIHTANPAMGFAGSSLRFLDAFSQHADAFNVERMDRRSPQPISRLPSAHGHWNDR